MENSQTNTAIDLLEKIDQELVQANGWKRLANLIIDSILSGILYNFVEKFKTILLPDFDTHLANSWVIYFLISFSFSSLFSLMYMFANEYFMKGKSIGKLITGTRAVEQDGSTLTVKSAFMRSLVRMVPFDALSALGSPCFPWHDRWTNTYVIDEAKSNYQLAD